jgi:hypothetical protein
MNKASRAAVLLMLLLAPAYGGQSNTKSAQPISLHPENPHYFLFRGKTVALITSGEHYGAVLNADIDFQRYLNTLQSDSLNYTRIFGGSYVEVPGKSFGILRNDLAPAPGRYIAPWSRSETPGYAGGGNKFDLDRWDPIYLQRFREFLSAASERGIVVEISLFSSLYGDAQWGLNVFNPANNVNHAAISDRKKLHTLQNGDVLAYQERYVRKLVHEANAFDNVVFEIQNEPWSDRPVPIPVIAAVNSFLQPPARDNFPNSSELADELSLAWQTKVVEWITGEEAALPNKHLIAQNYTNFRQPIRKSLCGVGVVNFHYAYPEAAQWNYGLDKAIAYDETGFMGRDDDSYRRQAWNFMMSGGSIFDALDYSFSPGHEDGSDTEPNGPGGGSPALRHQLHILSEFLQSFSLTDLRPDANTVKQATGVIARALSTPTHEYAIYFDGSGPTEVTLSLPPGQYFGDWMNVSTGKIESREMFQYTGGEKILNSPDFKNGIALRLKRVQH